jgi:hypothetical protein
MTATDKLMETFQKETQTGRNRRTSWRTGYSPSTFISCRRRTYRQYRGPCLSCCPGFY